MIGGRTRTRTVDRLIKSVFKMIISEYL